MRGSKKEARTRRHNRVRKKIFGIPDKPRLNVFKSLRHTYAQLIDDSNEHTVVSVSSVDKELKGKLDKGDTIEAAKAIGALIASRALGKGIKKAAFDKGGYPYHGRVKALADAAREGGLEF